MQKRYFSIITKDPWFFNSGNGKVNYDCYCSVESRKAYHLALNKSRVLNQIPLW